MWIARDKNEGLWLYIAKPQRSEMGEWWNVSLKEYDCLKINGELFPELRWEDEPIEVELVRKEVKL